MSIIAGVSEVESSSSKIEPSSSLTLVIKSMVATRLVLDVLRDVTTSSISLTVVSSVEIAPAFASIPLSLTSAHADPLYL